MIESILSLLVLSAVMEKVCLAPPVFILSPVFLVSSNSQSRLPLVIDYNFCHRNDTNGAREKTGFKLEFSTKTNPTRNNYLFFAVVKIQAILLCF